MQRFFHFVQLKLELYVVFDKGISFWKEAGEKGKNFSKESFLGKMKYFLEFKKRRSMTVEKSELRVTVYSLKIPLPDTNVIKRI